MRLTRERFPTDARDLAGDVEKALQAAEARRQSESHAKSREQEAGVKTAEIGPQYRELQPAPSLSAEQIAKAEELANWEFIKASRNPQDFRDHLARFPRGITERMAKTSLEAVVWPKLGRTPQLEELESFLGEFPDGMHSAEALTRADKIRSVRQLARAAKDREQRQVEAWNEARNADTKDAYEAFLKEWPDSPQAKSARSRLRMLQSPRPNVPEWLVPAIVTFVLLVTAATAVATFVWPPETKTSYDKLAPIPPNGKNPLDALVPNIQIGKTLSDTLVPNVANGKNLSNDQAAPVPNLVFTATPGNDVAPTPRPGSSSQNVSVRAGVRR